MSKLTTILLCSSAFLLTACGSGEEDHGDGHGHDNDGVSAEFVMPTSGKVFFSEPADGATVSSPVKVVFGTDSVGVNPAGELKANTGHHHILINKGAIEPGTIVPADDQHIHFGGGQTETELELEPGEYTLTMQLADGIHRSYGEKFAATIKITVE
jgi:hypothetical protein